MADLPLNPNPEPTGFDAAEFLRAVGPTEPQVFNAERFLREVETPGGAALDEEEQLARFVGQDKLGEPGKDMPFASRALLGFLGDSFEEQKKAFEMITQGKGELFQAPASDIILFRNDKSEQWRKVDAGFLEQFGLGPKGFVREVGGDIADIASDVPEIAGEAAALAFKRAPGVRQALEKAIEKIGGAKLAGKIAGGKPSLIADLMALGLGGAGGEGVQQLVQDYVKTQDDETQAKIERALGAGVSSIIGGTLGAGAKAGVNMFTGRGLTSLPIEAQEAREAAERIGVRPFLAPQISDVPFVQRLGRQAQQFLPKLARWATDQEREVSDALQAASNQADRLQFMERTTRAFRDASRDIVDFAADVAKTTRTTDDPYRVGRELQKGITEWWKRAGTAVDNLYMVARSIEEPVFDLTPLQAKSMKILEGKQGTFAADAPVKPATDIATLRSVSPQAKTRMAMDRAIQQGGEKIEETRRINDLNAEVMKVATDLQGYLAKPTNVSVTDQLREFQKRVADLAIPGPEGSREPNRVAADLVGAIKETLQNPQNANPEFLRAWQRANGAASLRFDTRERLAVVDMFKTEVPAEKVKQFAQPGNLEALVTIRKATDDESWRKFQDWFKSDLLSDPFTLNEKITKWGNDKGLNLLLDKPERDALRNAGERLARLDSLPVRRAKEIEAPFREFFTEVFGNQSGVGIRGNVLFDLVDKEGGLDSPLGKTIQSALIDNLFDRAKYLDKGVEKIDFAKYDAGLKEYADNGLTRFLTNQQQSILGDVRKVADFLRVERDAGSSLQAASAAASLGQFKDEAVGKVMHAMGVGRFVMSPMGSAILMGKGLPKVETQAFAQIGAAAAQMAADAEEQAAAGETITEALRKAKLAGRAAVAKPYNWLTQDAE